jgi:hypothetical protein
VHGEGRFRSKQLSVHSARGFLQLEEIKLGDHWAIIYSKLDIGCALEKHSGIDCKGYTQARAANIAAWIVMYATLT